MAEVDFNAMRVSLLEQIAELDEKMDSWQDSTTAGKRKIKNELVDERKDSWSKVVTALSEQLDNIEDPRQRYGSFLGFMRALEDKYAKAADAYVAELVESQPKTETVEVSDDVKKSTAEERSKLYSNFKKLRDLVIGFGAIDEDDPDWVMPQTRRSNVGKRGKRALSLMTWAIDGTEVSEDDDNQRGVATLLGFEKSSDFTKALKDAGVNTTQPGDGFEVEIKGKVVSATRVAEATSDSDEDEDEDSSDE